ncbi:hypothetical protein PR048_004839 [Dryococelus australis]|uniref:Integrase catalytic domain-containing protein n=1 Tax=Dryococelus australis TaxID=614101 RepID=A0ABQ9I6J2_9NEOP|nr:hypothetical protein PR048_004839 [Dryococelus australis]
MFMGCDLAPRRFMRKPQDLSLECSTFSAILDRDQSKLIGLQTSAADAVKSMLLISFVGDDFLQTFNTFEFSVMKGSNKEKFSDVVSLFRRYCSPKRNTTYERFMFSQRKWEEGEKFDNFLTSLKTLRCEDQGLQETLLRLEDTSLDAVVQRCRLIELSELQAQQINATSASASTYRSTCLARAGSIMYLPGWAQDMRKLIKQCRVYEKYAPKNKRHKYHSREISRLPFERVAVDILEYGGKSYMVLIDAYSKWVEITPLRGKTPQDVIEACKTLFAIHGDPQILSSDNVPFNSIEFLQSARGNFQCQFSSPKYAQSNGLAEKGIYIAEQLLCKCSDTNTDYREALREYRNTPIPGLGASPSQLLNSRLREYKQQWYNRRAGGKEVAFDKGQNIFERSSNDKYWETGFTPVRNEELDWKDVDFDVDLYVNH